MTTFDKIKHYLKSLTRDEKKEVRRRLKEEGGGESDKTIVVYPVVLSNVYFDEDNGWEVLNDPIGQSGMAVLIYPIYDNIKDVIFFSEEHLNNLLEISADSVNTVFTDCPYLPKMNGASYSPIHIISSYTEFDSDKYNILKHTDEFYAIMIGDYYDYVNHSGNDDYIETNYWDLGITYVI